MEPQIFDYKNRPKENICVGNKAFNLYTIIDEVQVPHFITIESCELLNILKLKENSMYSERIKTLWLNKLSLFNYFSMIKKMISELYIPESWIAYICRKLDDNKIKGELAVRSSSVYEDTDNKSAPGVFETVLHVKREQLEKAIKECWASNFTMKSMGYFGNDLDKFENIKMGIIIQEMVDCDEAGILFTRNPINNKCEFVIESVQGECDKLTDGSAIAKTEFVRKKTNSSFDDLINIAQRLKEKMNKEIDIEWACKEKKVFVLQVRPISTLNTKFTEEHRIISISELDKLNYVGSELASKILRWTGKKMHFNYACDIEGIPHLKWFFVQNYIDEMQEEVEEIVGNMQGQYITLAINNTLSDIVIDKNKIIYFLKSYDKAGNRIVSIREIPINQISMISTCIENEKVYIEVIDGIMKGLKTGELEPSKYIVENGNVKVKEEIHNKKCYQIHFPDGEISLKDNYVEKYYGIDSYLVMIEKYTKKIKKHSQVGAIEWWICDNKLFATDISLDLSYINVIKGNDECKYLSQGSIEGIAIFLSDTQIQQMGDIAYGQGISVDYYDDSIENFKFYESIKRKLTECKSCGKIVLCVKRPMIGIVPFLDCVDGLIFEEASVLCHLSVVLREKGIPALAIGEKYNDIKEGQYLLIG